MKKKIYFLSVLIFSSLLVSCSSTNGLKESDRPFSYINTNLTEKQLSSESYVFIRLYDISYDKALRPGNFLRGPIRILGKAGNGRYYVHSAVSHGLRDDSFVGLTLTDKKNNIQQKNEKFQRLENSSCRYRLCRPEHSNPAFTASPRKRCGCYPRKSGETQPPDITHPGRLHREIPG